MSENVMDIPIELIMPWKWDVRRKEEKEEDLTVLATNISKHGLLNAITVIPDGKKYKVIAGRRRLAACKKIGMKTITAFVKTDLPEDTDIKLVTSSENTVRKDVDDTEKAYGWLDIYQTAGYTPTQAIQGTKWLHNHKNDLKSPEVANKTPLNNSRERLEFTPDQKFIETCKRISHAPNTQYQLLQWVVQLERKVLEKADKNKLSRDQKILLTTKSLRNHPKIQMELVDEMKEMSDDTSRARVEQVSSDLDTGYYQKTTGGTYIVDNTVERQTKKDSKVLDPPDVRILDITAGINKFLFQMTGHKLSRGQHDYKIENIDYTIDYRLETIKVLSERDLIALEEEIKLVSKVSKETLNLISEEFKARDMKKGMAQK
jgi:ParB-like chromosome segregation protein Spo0J